ncbi:MAG TPA: hypothetical protein VD902_08270, partial [Symbiobacteriaceae bacterium]|nr:hypothetical protein [Symbiobacteriaceae bacterium]
MPAGATILHQLPGRLRLEVPGLYRRFALAEKLEVKLCEKPGVLAVRVSARTARVLLAYDSKRLTAGAAAAAVTDLLPAAEAAAADSERAPRPGPRARAGLPVALPATMLGVAVARGLLRTRSPLSDSRMLVGASTVLGLAAAIPVVRESLGRRGAGRRLNLLLAFGSLALLAMRGSIPGLTVLTLLNLSRWAEARAMAGADRLCGAPAAALPPNWPEPLAEPVPLSAGERRLTLLSLAAAGGVFLLTRKLDRALAVLAITSPAVRNAAGPMARHRATAAGVEMGIHPCSSGALERVSQADTVLLEVPYTLTTGEPAITRAFSVHPDYAERDVLQMAASALADLPRAAARGEVGTAASLGEQGIDVSAAGLAAL